MRSLLHVCQGFSISSQDERNPSSRVLTQEVTLVKQVQEQVHDAASETDTWAQPPWLLPGMELRKTSTCEALCLQRRVSRQKRGSGELSKTTPPDKRRSHNKLTLETSNREISWAPWAGERKENKSAVRIDRQLPGQSSAYTSMCHLSFCPLPLRSSPGSKSGTKPFPQQRGTGMYPHKPRTCEGKAGDMIFSSRNATSPHIFLSHNRAEKPLSPVTVLSTKLQGPRQDRLCQALRDARIKHSLIANLHSALSPWAPAPSHRAPAAWQM